MKLTLDYIESAKIDKPCRFGRFRSVKVMEEALAGGKLDVIGLARPFCLHYGQDIFDGKATRFTPVPKIE